MHEPATTQIVAKTPGGDSGQAVLAEKEDVQEARKADEAAERDRVKQAEPPGVAHPQYVRIGPEWTRRRLIGTVLRENHEQYERRQQRNQGQAEDGMPAPCLGEPGAKERGKCCPAVARRGDSHHQALILRGIPATRQWQRRREAGSGDTKEQPHEQNLGVRCRPKNSRATGERPSTTCQESPSALHRCGP